VQTQKIGEVFEVLEAKFVSRDQCYKMLKLHVAMQEVDKLADNASCNDTTVMVLEEVFQSQSKSRERESPQICQVSVLTDFNKSYLNKMRNQTV